MTGDRHGIDDAVHGLGSGVLWTYANVGVLAASNLFLVGYAIRQLGAAEYGTFAIIQALSLLLYVIDFGLGLGVVRSAARWLVARDSPDRDEAAAAVETSHQVYLKVGLVVAGVAVAGAVGIGLVRGDTGEAVTFLLVMMAAAVDLALAALQGLATGLRAFGVVARASIAGVVVSTVVTVALLPQWDLPALGAGQLLGVLVARSLLIRWSRVRAPWVRLSMSRTAWADVKRVLVFALPLVVVSAGMQLISTVNLLLIGALVSSAGVGLYRAASVLPAQTVSVLFRGVDVTFPGLVSVADPTEQERLNGLLTRIACYVSGVVFGVMIFCRDPITQALIGSPSPLAAKILATFCLVWLVNVPVHGLILLVVARGEQRMFLALTGIEAALNLPLTVVLSVRYGAEGAAMASLVTIVASNAVILPIMVRRVRVGGVARVVYLDGFIRSGIGLLTALVAYACVAGHVHDAVSAVVVGLVAVGLAVPVGALSIGADGRSLAVRATRSRHAVA